MRILLVSFYYAPELGAAPSRITNMAEGLKSQGAEVEVLTCLPNYPKGRIFEGYRHRLRMTEIINGIKIYRYWTYATVSKKPISRALSMVSYAAMIWLFALKRKTIMGYDRVIVQSPPLPVANSALHLFKKLYKRITILNVSDLWPISAVELGAMKEGSSVHRWFCKLEKFNYKNADAIFGQSNVILEHVAGFPSSGKRFLYRNLQKFEMPRVSRRRNGNLKIVYAGLLGVAQDILGIIQNIDLEAVGAELHLYGGGNQTESIQEYIKDSKNIFYHGYVDKSLIASRIAENDVALIPLAVSILGAVPSKIFDTVPVGLPILFCGGGEGAAIVNEFGLGLVSPSGDYDALFKNIELFVKMSDEEYEAYSKRCIEAALSEFDFDKQMEKAYSFIQEL